MPLRSDWSAELCPIARTLDVVGDPWALLVLRQALSGARRFEEFRSALGIADNVLSRRLRTLVEQGLLERSPYTDSGRTRDEYLLTPAGSDLLPVVHALLLWGEKHRPHDDPAVRMAIVHRGCGQVSRYAEVCSECGEELRPDDVTWRKSWREPQDLPLVGARPQ
ncbi:winged helix-turn-helix transcriptional regulator [Nakamurella endophytica]|uniref:HxlR family transcriptional regulator n=1 Tax=Nakamurella endophytica TaxID=1748367 RepID=A0A917SVS7_9ACTN|nr:helix-turn-helix domain-containing protein [Nakamurella endophytica]GGM00015.1 HxlR family transcriptional regulator [Nakamurella endophytica]